MVKPGQTLIRNGIETSVADLHTPSCIITLGVVYKWSVDISTENFSLAIENIINFLRLILILKHILCVILT